MSVHMTAILVFADKAIQTEFVHIHTHTHKDICISRSFFSSLTPISNIIISDLNLYLPGLNKQSNFSQPQHSFAHHSCPNGFQVCSNLQNKLYMNCSFKVIRSTLALDILERICWLVHKFMDNHYVSIFKRLTIFTLITTFLFCVCQKILTLTVHPTKLGHLYNLEFQTRSLSLEHLWLNILSLYFWSWLSI